MSRVTRLSPLWLSASSSACHGLLIITVITLPTKPNDKKCQRTEAGERSSAACRCVSVMLLRSMQNTRIIDAKAENDALRDDVAAGRRGCIKAVCQSVREATTASGVDNATSPRLADTCERDYFTLSLITTRNSWKEPRSILMSSADRVAHIDGQLMQLL